MSHTATRLATAAAMLALGAGTLAAQNAAAAAPPAAHADTACAACTDFYRFANQKWLDSTTIPAAYPSWGSFYELYERNQGVLRTILDAASANHAAAPGSTDAKLGAFYGTCMDSTAAETAGAAPIRPWLDRIAAASTPSQVQAVAASMRHDGMTALWSLGSTQDDKASTRVVASISQGGLGLPDRDYYLKTDSASVALRKDYVDHVSRVFQLLGETPAAAGAHAARVLAIETAMAGAQMTRVQQRDPNAIYHKLSMAELRALAPNVEWATWMRELRVPAVDSVIVRQPEFVRVAGGLLRTVPVADWKAYLRWHAADEAAPYLSKAWVNENFRFNSKLNGAKELLPRWKRCLESTDGSLGELLGQAYVQRTFTPEAKARALNIVRNLQAALHDRLGALSWMSDSTKRQAIGKLDAFMQKIGYPDRWRDYSGLPVQRRAFVLNVLAAQRFERDRQISKIGQPVDRAEWGMSPPTVNAYYNPALNEIVFPAGILQQPFFDPAADDATNYGGMGAVIGHEMTHGFDDEGRQYDAQGNLRDWWTAEDARLYNAQAERIRSQFAGYTAVDTLHLNGQLTSGENIADLGGLTIAYAALQKSMEGKPHEVINGYTPEQRFFLSWAHIWREQSRPEYARYLVTVDPHSPGRWRVNGPLANMPEFAQAFQCKAGDPMVRADADRVRIW
ncbi:MAG: family metallopeptidase [Gemmatimonadetes bacterium]|nr:family metallopeptidase [Gemmatimonadota bacterium]